MLFGHMHYSGQYSTAPEDSCFSTHIEPGISLTVHFPAAFKHTHLLTHTIFDALVNVIDTHTQCFHTASPRIQRIRKSPASPHLALGKVPLSL